MGYIGAYLGLMLGLNSGYTGILQNKMETSIMFIFSLSLSLAITTCFHDAVPKQKHGHIDHGYALCAA